MSGPYVHALEQEHVEFVREIGSAQNGGVVLTLDGVGVHVAAGIGGLRVGVTVSFRALADALDRLRAQRGAHDQHLSADAVEDVVVDAPREVHRDAGTEEQHSVRSIVFRQFEGPSPTAAVEDRLDSVLDLMRLLVGEVRQLQLPVVERPGRHDSPSVETRTALERGAQVVDTVGDPTDAAAGSPSRAVSVVESVARRPARARPTP